MNTKLVDKMRSIGFTVEQESVSKNVTSGRLAHVLRFMDEINELPIGQNKEAALERLNTTNDGFCGGTLSKLQSNLNGDIDMHPFNAARDKFAQSDLASKLREAYQDCQPRRIRVKSEHDGEWEESRRYDIAPYQGVRKALGGGRCIDVIADSCVNGSTDSDDINKYGCMVWALVEIIESMGVNCRVVFRYHSNGLWLQGNGTAMIECKKAGEYIAPSLLAAVSQSIFFRRAIFSLFVTMADCQGKTVSYSLGQARNADKAIEFKDGVLTLSPMVSNASFAEIEKELIKTVGEK